MDPITLIVSALAAGAAVALQDATAQAIKDAYGSFKALLKRKLRYEPLTEDVVDKHEQAPDVWEKPLEEQLRSAGIGDDEELIRAAQSLLARVDPDGARSGKYNVSISGGKGIVVGDHANVTMSFDGD
jgi:hypothetical protein